MSRPVRLVRQTNRWNCGSACLAMLLGLDSTEAAEARLGREPATPHPDLDYDEAVGHRVGVLSSEVSTALFDVGICHVVWYPPETYGQSVPWLAKGWDRFCLYSVSDIERMVFREGRTAMLGVPSKRFPGGGHWVVVAEGRVLDPTDGDEPYVTGEQLTVTEAVVLR